MLEAEDFLVISWSVVSPSGGACAPGVYSSDIVMVRNLTLSTVATFFGDWSEEKQTVAAHDFPANARLISREDKQSTKNVALIVLESTRPQSLTVYNPELKTTPNLQALAEHSLVAHNAYTPVPRTSKALVSILCGIYPNMTVAITEARPRGIPARCLPELLHEHGYHTGYFQSATERFENRREVVANMGFADFFPLEALDTQGFEKANYFGFEDDVLLPPSERWLRKHGDKPFLATYLTVTPHHPYFAPSQRYGRIKFNDDEVLNRYLNTVRYADIFVANLIEQYKRLGLYQNTVFVIVSDHGEAFYEHGRRHHSTVIYEEGLRVLTLIHDPSRFQEGIRVDVPTTHIDLLPTVAHLLGFELRDGNPEAANMLSLDEQRPIISSCFRARSCMSLRRGNLKYIHHFGQREDEIFDLDRDPTEQHSFLNRVPGIAASMRQEIISFRQKMMGRYALYHKERLEMTERPLDGPQTLPTLGGLDPARPAP